MLSRVCSVASFGLETLEITVEVNIASKSFPSFNIVGLPSKAIEEAKERVRTAILNSNIDFPQKRITVNLAPADLPKEGSCYDLPIALGIIRSLLDFPIPENRSFSVNFLWMVACVTPREYCWRLFLPLIKVLKISSCQENRPMKRR